MKHLKNAKKFLPLAAALFLGILTELMGFQLDDILLKINGPRTVALDLASFPGYNGEGIPVLPEAGTYSFDQLGFPTKNVTITLKGAPQTLKGLLSICDEASAYRTVGAAQFLVNPGGGCSTLSVRVNSHGNLSRLRISFEDQADAVTITSVVFNQPSIDFSWLRTILFCAVFILVFCIFKYQLYRETLNLDTVVHKLLSLGSLLVCLGISFILFYESTPSGSYLRPPLTQEELHSYESEPAIGEAYAEQLDAFEKGQIALDLAVNPELLELDNVYDKGERDKKEVEYHWDRAFYNGSYYSYFGLAPLFTVYYPIYWLTGMLPLAPLCLFILTVFAIISIFFALNAMIRFFRLKPNLLLYLLGIPALMGGTMLYMLQSNLNYYYYPILSALGWLGAFIAFSFYGCLSFASAGKYSNPYSLSRSRRNWLLCGLSFFCAGVSVVMIVLSRPNLALLAIAFALPAYLNILLNRQADTRQKLTAVLPFLTPVLLGAAGICWYNYVRFNSVFEFGTTFQLTESDIHYNSFTLSFHHFKSMLYHYFAEPLTWKEFFPYLELSLNSCFDFGNHLYYECNAGLLNLPLNFGIFLIGYTCFSKAKTAPLQKPTYILSLGATLLLGYIDFIMAGILIRYVADLALPISVLSLLLILEHIPYRKEKAGQILYFLAVAVLTATIMIGILMAFSNENYDLEKINPDFFISTARLLRGW